MIDVNFEHVFQGRLNNARFDVRCVWDTFHRRFIKKTGAQNNSTLAYSNIENFANNASILTNEDILEIGDAGLSNELSFRTQFPF